VAKSEIRFYRVGDNVDEPSGGITLRDVFILILLIHLGWALLPFFPAGMLTFL